MTKSAVSCITENFIFLCIDNLESVVLSILNLHLCSFNGCLTWIFYNGHFQNSNFLSLKNSSPGKFLGSFKTRRYHWFLKLFVATQKSEVLEQKCVWLFYYFNFERKFEVLKSKSAYFLLNKKLNVNKNEAESKMENSTLTFLHSRLSSCFLSQCIVYWINFQNIYTYTNQKTLLHTLFCLFLKSLKAFSVSLILRKTPVLKDRCFPLTFVTFLTTPIL